MVYPTNKPHKHPASQKTVGECVFIKNQENAIFICYTNSHYLFEVSRK